MKDSSVSESGILVEAEAFDDYGGWVLDSQFEVKMGSPYLFAHGLGRPVADATMYSKDIDNLMMAGKHISVTHVAGSATKLMGNGAQHGVAVGAARICVSSTRHHRVVCIATIWQSSRGKWKHRPVATMT